MASENSKLGEKNLRTEIRKQDCGSLLGKEASEKETEIKDF